MIERVPVTITTSAGGAGTGYAKPTTPGALFLGLRYVKDGTTPYDNGVGLTVTCELTGQAALIVANMNASATYYPRQQVHEGADASGLTYDGTRKQEAPVPVGHDDRLKLVIASGGDTKTGLFHALFGSGS